MKKTLTTIAIAALMGLALNVQAAEFITHVEGRMIGTYTMSNGTDRAIAIESIFFAPNGDASVTNAITVKLINVQNTDLTGTNATLSNVTYTLGTASFAGGTATSLIPTVAYRIPAGATVNMTNSIVTCTNDFIMIRKEVE